MREIKYRLWCELENKEGVTMAMLDHDCLLKWTLEDLTSGSKDILMQYTGLLDKNGKEIYEGDIVRVMTGESYYEEEERMMCDEEVKWDNASAGYFIRDKEVSDMCEYMPSLGDESFVLEIIGNIYENPELTSHRLKEDVKRKNI